MCLILPQVNQNPFYRESDLLYVRKQCEQQLSATVRFDRILQQTVLQFANLFSKYRTVCSMILSNPTVAVHLVSLLLCTANLTSNKSLS